MPVRAHGLRSETSEFDLDEGFAFGELDPGERIYQAQSRGGSSMLSSLMIVLVAVGGGWALLRYQPDLVDKLSSRIASVSATMGYRAPPPIAPPAAAVPPPLETANPAPTPVVHSVDPPPAQPPDAAGEAMKSENASVITATITPPADAPIEPLPPPRPNPSDPYQTRAVAVGLHPDISRALLSRLTKADYRNAGVAIDTAVAKTPDNAVFVWPRQRKPELALFEVRFVAGAAPHCRRYVVTVTKDRWSTTAPPMERCSSPKSGAERLAPKPEPRA